MELNVNDIIQRYEEELRVATRRAILAEVELAQMKGEQENSGNDES